MHLGKNNPNHNYTMSGNVLDTVNEEKDLGVIVDDKLNFRKHISTAVKKAQQMLGLIKHTFSCLDETTIPWLYKALVRPHLEYGNVIWSPYTKKG